MKNETVVHLVASHAAPFTDLLAPLTSAGFMVRERYGYGTTPHPVEGHRPYCLHLIVVGRNLPWAEAVTQRLRAEHPQHSLLWLVDHHTVEAAVHGFEAGADACLVRPVPAGLLVAQVKALVRAAHMVSTAPSHRIDAPDLNIRLQQHLRQTESEVELTRRVVEAIYPREPVRVGSFQCAWYYQPSVQGASTFDVDSISPGCLRWTLTDGGGLGFTVGTMVASVVSRLLLRELPQAHPAAALRLANQFLREIHAPEGAIVASTVGSIDAKTGAVTVACGGLPAPLLVPTDGSAVVWHGSGPFLGTADTEFFNITGVLKPGEKLLFLAGGATANQRSEIRGLAEASRTLPAPAFVNAIASSLLPDSSAEDGITLLVVERNEG